MFHVHRERTQERVIGWCRHHTVTNGVRQHVPRRGQCVLVGPEYAFEIAALPQSTACCLFPLERASLLEDPNKLGEASRRISALDERVKMIRHEAVRRNREPFVNRRTTQSQ